MNPINNVLQHFPDARKSGSGWSTRCPAHEDRNPSLSISEGRDGRVLLHCHAGCDVSDICRKKGLSLADLMAPSLARNPFKGPATRRRGHGSAEEAIRYAERRLGSRAREWRYFDATDGMHIGSIVRWDRPDGGKDIRPFSLKNGEWRAEGMDSPRPLYNRGATVGAEMAVVTEGEKAADAATALGYIAVTSAHGANSAQNTDWSSMTRSASVSRKS